MAEIHARDLYRLVQSARLRSTDFLAPGLNQRFVNALNKILHLGQRQACSTMVSQRSFLDDIELGVETSLISSGETVAPATRRVVIKEKLGYS